MIAKRFASLAELMADHAGLVRRVGSELLAGVHPNWVAEFVRCSVATGAALDARDDRAAAQEVVGFWTARMATAAREQARAARRSDTIPATEAATLPDFGDTLLVPYDAATLKEALAAADAKLEKVDPALVRRLLLRLVRLRPLDAKFDAAPTSRGSLCDLPGGARGQRIRS